MKKFIDFLADHPGLFWMAGAGLGALVASQIEVNLLVGAFFGFIGFLALTMILFIGGADFSRLKRHGL